MRDSKVYLDLVCRHHDADTADNAAFSSLPIEAHRRCENGGAGCEALCELCNTCRARFRLGGWTPWPPNGSRIAAGKEARPPPQASKGFRPRLLSCAIVDDLRTIKK